MTIITYSDTISQSFKYQKPEKQNLRSTLIRKKHIKAQKQIISNTSGLSAISSIDLGNISFLSNRKHKLNKRITPINWRQVEVFTFTAILLSYIVLMFFYVPLIKRILGVSDLKKISFWEEPSLYNAMRVHTMPFIEKPQENLTFEDSELDNTEISLQDMQALQKVTFKVYTVGKGDTISSITQKFGLKKMGTLLSVNDISNARSLKSGQKLQIPSIDGINYSVKKGDTLNYIANKFAIDIHRILDSNDLEHQALFTGQRLFIPGAAMNSFDFKKALGELFIYPITGRLTSPFGYRRDPFTGRKSFHTGIDIASPIGTPIKSTLDGQVSYTGYSAIYGNYIIITHDGGYQSMYGHLSRIAVKRGVKIKQGGIIGNVGNTGRSTGPHVHFSVYKNGKLIDPLTVLGKL